MRLESTPVRQRKHNDAVHQQLRLVGTFSALLVIAAFVLEATLYFGPESKGNRVPTVVAPDGTTVGTAVVVAVDYALTTVEVPTGVMDPVFWTGLL